MTLHLLASPQSRRVALSKVSPRLPRLSPLTGRVPTHTVGELQLWRRHRDIIQLAWSSIVGNREHPRQVVVVVVYNGIGSSAYVFESMEETRKADNV